jgi:ABC-type uncharacterized transport system permease subunit
MSVISVKNLKKYYQVYQKEPGLLGSIKSLFNVEFIRGFLTFIIPVALVYTFPAKAIFGLLNPTTIITGICGLIIFYLLSLKFWHYALTKYSSASS